MIFSGVWHDLSRPLHQGNNNNTCQDMTKSIISALDFLDLDFFFCIVWFDLHILCLSCAVAICLITDLPYIDPSY